MEHLKKLIRTIPDFPKPGIQFRDITTLINCPNGFRETMDILYRQYRDQQIDMVAGIDARGFIFGAALAMRLGTGFVPIRKPGKLPGDTLKIGYELEYGSGELEVHEGSITHGQRVLVVDDLLATGGTLEASCHLIHQMGGEVIECAVVVELPDLKGRDRLQKYPVYSMLTFEGE